MFRFTRFVNIATVLLLFSSCSSTLTYQKKSTLGGYEDRRLSESTFEITYWGNGWTSPDLLENGVLRRAAEVALSYDRSHFYVLEKAPTLVGKARIVIELRQESELGADDDLYSAKKILKPSHPKPQKKASSKKAKKKKTKKSRRSASRKKSGKRKK